MQLQQEKQIAKLNLLRKCGLLALNLASIFEKLLDQKTFCFCAPHRWSNLFFILQIPHTFGSHSALFHVKQCSWKNNCVRFSRIASLSACVLFAGGCVVRIGYESFLDFGFSEFFMPSEWRTAVHFVSLRSLLLLIIHSLQGAACPLHPSPSWASSTAFACDSNFWTAL